MATSNFLLLLATVSLGCLPRVIQSAPAGNISASFPTVNLNNGTVIGQHHSTFYQDMFLGIPYAQPPIGQLRFAPPKALESRWASPKYATNYGPFCLGNSLDLVGFDQDSITYPENEDCLSINVVRPASDFSLRDRSSTESELLPVLVWIYGGGFQEGGSGDARYNMSYLVQTSVDMGRPIIGVSFNYRLGVFGFISGKTFREAGATNLGIHDQRLALRWIQENIAAFGGDPSRVTIHGESAGALSVGFHLLANGGRDDGLFHGAIAQSGGPFFHVPFASEAVQDKLLESLVQGSGCANSSDSMSCLQHLPAEALKNASAGFTWNPIIDHDLFSELNSVALRNGSFVPVPLLIGSNTNEGTPFLPVFTTIGANSSSDLAAALQRYARPTSLSNETIRQFDELYSAAVELEPEPALGTVLADPGYPYGPLYGKLSTLVGDLTMTAGRRISAEAWTASGAPAYTYRFDTVPAGVNPKILGAAHFQEVSFVFRNTLGNGYELNPFNLSDHTAKARYLEMSELMSRMWISFVNTGTPNYHGVDDFGIEWPKYDLESPVNMVFNATAGVALEPDAYRREAINYISDTAVLFNR